MTGEFQSHEASVSYQPPWLAVYKEHVGISTLVGVRIGGEGQRD